MYTAVMLLFDAEYASTSPSVSPPMIATVAPSKLASVTKSTSDTVMLALTTVALSFSVYATGCTSSTPPSTGASFTGVTVTVRATVALCASPSLTSNVMVRFDADCVPVGSSELLLNVTKRNAVCQPDTDALPLSPSTPVLESYTAVMPANPANPDPLYASTSPD